VDRERREMRRFILAFLLGAAALSACKDSGTTFTFDAGSTPDAPKSDGGGSDGGGSDGGGSDGAGSDHGGSDVADADADEDGPSGDDGAAGG
jgi:hypothetical protein